MKNYILTLLLGMGLLSCTPKTAIALEEIPPTVEDLYLTMEEVTLIEGEYILSLIHI